MFFRKATPDIKAKAPSPLVEQVSADIFMDLIGSMSRLLSQIGRAEPFKDAKLGLGEWAALSAIRSTPNTNNKQLARTLGVTGQRINQISDALKRDGLITSKQSEQDSRRNILTITDLGNKRLAELNSKLTPLLEEGLKGSGRSIRRTSKTIKKISRAFHPPKAVDPSAKAAPPTA